VRDWSNETGGETSEWNALLASLPEVELPKGLFKHSTLEYGLKSTGDDDDEDEGMNEEEAAGGANDDEESIELLL